MPGAKGFAEAATWFEECFGFKELSYRETQKRFTFADGVLTSTVNQAKFHVGPFETPALSELEEGLAIVGGRSSWSLPGCRAACRADAVPHLSMRFSSARCAFRKAGGHIIASVREGVWRSGLQRTIDGSGLTSAVLRGSSLLRFLK